MTDNQTAKAAPDDLSANPIPTEEKTPAPGTPDSFKDRLAKARLSMEGPERTAKREEEETERRVKTETGELEKELALIGHQKEKLEINWVVLDTKQGEMKTLLTPLKKEEEVIELEEDRLEGEEHTTSDVAKRQDIEKKRWVVQDKRQDLEKRKWEIENKVLAIEADLKKNTADYQQLLDQEEEINKKIKSLEYEAEAAKERARLEEERERAEEERLLVEAEEKRRAEEKKKTEEEEARRKAELLAQQKAEEETRQKAETEKKKNEDEARQKAEAERTRKLAEEQKARATLEVRRQEEARRQEAEKLKQKSEAAERAATPVVESAPPVPAEDETKKRAALLEKARAAAASQVVETADLTAPDTPAATVEGSIGSPSTGPGDEEDVPSFLPNETTNLPHLRTFKSDIEDADAGLSAEQIKEARKNFPWLK